MFRFNVRRASYLPAIGVSVYTSANSSSPKHQITKSSIWYDQPQIVRNLNKGACAKNVSSETLKNYRRCIATASKVLRFGSTNNNNSSLGETIDESERNNSMRTGTSSLNVSQELISAEAEEHIKTFNVNEKRYVQSNFGKKKMNTNADTTDEVFGENNDKQSRLFESNKVFSLNQPMTPEEAKTHEIERKILSFNALRRMHMAERPGIGNSSGSTEINQRRKQIEAQAWRTIQSISESDVEKASSFGILLVVSAWSYFSRFWENSRRGPMPFSAEEYLRFYGNQSDSAKSSAANTAKHAEATSPSSPADNSTSTASSEPAVEKGKGKGKGKGKKSKKQAEIEEAAKKAEEEAKTKAAADAESAANTPAPPKVIPFYITPHQHEELTDYLQKKYSDPAVLNAALDEYFPPAKDVKIIIDHNAAIVHESDIHQEIIHHGEDDAEDGVNESVDDGATAMGGDGEGLVPEEDDEAGLAAIVNDDSTESLASGGDVKTDSVKRSSSETSIPSSQPRSPSAPNQSPHSFNQQYKKRPFDQNQHYNGRRDNRGHNPEGNFERRSHGHSGSYQRGGDNGGQQPHNPPRKILKRNNQQTECAEMPRSEVLDEVFE